MQTAAAAGDDEGERCEQQWLRVATGQAIVSEAALQKVTLYISFSFSTPA
jgi:hypothetical protein